ncbi:MAG: response regulator [Deltaproteobacteria bacterium]|nr:response regulator [Deltaproteobacteria bacterium]MBW2394394.1 response regulator [Deltaproteobacteria bacterium]
MSEASRPRILIVDDEEAILETMTFTFEDDYEVLTSSSAVKALELLEQQDRVAVVISDQRMPEMTGVEFLAQVFERHPTTVRIILTGFADMDAIIGSINDGHVYSYITKPWEPDDLKQIVRRAVEHYALAEENERLVGDLRDSNSFLQAVMDQLDTGALAVDANGIVRAVNAPARGYLGIEGDPHGRRLEDVLRPEALELIGGAVIRIRQDENVSYEEVELPSGDAVKLRVTMHPLFSSDGRELGQVILGREISHEPLKRRFEEIIECLATTDGELRGPLGDARHGLGSLAELVKGTGVASPGMSELEERTSRTLTAIEYWLAVDDVLVREDYPEAQPLLDRMRVATTRWPSPDRLPARVRELAQRVEAYYETGENPKQPVL